jgi:hypothetical protein
MSDKNSFCACVNFRFLGLALHEEVIQLGLKRGDSLRSNVQDGVHTLEPPLKRDASQQDAVDLQEPMGGTVAFLDGLLRRWSFGHLSSLVAYLIRR